MSSAPARSPDQPGQIRMSVVFQGEEHVRILPVRTSAFRGNGKLSPPTGVKQVKPLEELGPAVRNVTVDDFSY